jgi:hypothetical protein
MEDKHDQGVTSVKIPADRDLTNRNCKTCETWITLDQPEVIREALIQRNKLHFGQAQGTFPIKAPFSEKITWDADTPYSDLLLQGNIPFSDDKINEISKLFLEQFQRTTELDSIPTTITKEELTLRVTYSLPVNTIPENKLAKLQSQTYRRFLPKLGYNRNMPAAVVHGPSSLGGLDMCTHCSASSCTDGLQQEKWWQDTMPHFIQKSANPANIQ